MEEQQRLSPGTFNRRKLRRSSGALHALERHLEIPLSREELDRVLVAAEWAAGSAAQAAEAAAWAARAARAAAVATAWAAQAAARATALAAEATTVEAAAGAARAEARSRQSQIFEEIFG